MVVPPPCCIKLEKAVKWIALAYLSIIAGCLLILTVSLVVISMNYTPPSPTIIARMNTFPHLGVNDSTTVIANSRGKDEIRNSTDDTLIINNEKLYVKNDFVNQINLMNAMVIIITTFTVCIICLVLTVQLWKGAIEHNITKLRIWFEVQAVNFIMGLILLPLVLIVMVPQAHPGLWVAALLQIVVNLYVMWIVYAYMEQIEEEAKKAKAKREETEEKFISNKT